YQASWVYWTLGLFTAFLTSFYMFRLWFMTFFGEYRGEAEPTGDGHARPGAAAPHGAAAHGHEPGHGGVHESPRVMLVPLAILAVLSVAGGWIGVPGSLGGSNRFEEFLSPVFHSAAPVMDSAAEAGKRTESEPQTSHGTE